MNDIIINNLYFIFFLHVENKENILYDIIVESSKFK